MRLGLDIATYSLNRSTTKIIFMSEDTDLIPALKLARREGVEVMAVKVPNSRNITELLMHIDGEVIVAWPHDAEKTKTIHKKAK